MNKGITIAGNLIVDHVKMCDTYPEKGMLTNIRGTSSSIGGCAGNTICDIAKLDPTVPLTCIGRIGNDSDGVFIKNQLCELGINTDKVIVDDTVPTSYTDVMSAMDSNERTFFHASGANAAFSKADININDLDCDIFHIGYILLLDKFDETDPEYGTVLASLLKDVQNKGIKTSIDVVSENSDRFTRLVPPALKYCNYLIINEVEAAITTGICVRNDDKSINNGKINESIKALFSMGVKDAVCIHSPEGGWYGTPDGLVYYAPSVNVPKSFIKGKVGAGDAFCAGMLYSLYRGFEPEYCLKVAGAAAACNLSEKDSISGLRPLNEAMKLYDIYE